MKAEKISEHIWSLKSWMIIPIHVWIVVEEDGVVLVDAGIGTMTKGILTFIDRLGAGPLKAVVLTHGHSDHVGALKGIVRDRTIPVYAHRRELPYMEGELPYPGRKKAARTVQEGLVRPLQEDEGGALSVFGSLRPYWTPGHSPGHTVFYHERDRVMLAGDLFTAKKGRLRPPMAMFTSDMRQAMASGEIVGRLKPLRLEVCHGTTVLRPAEQLDGYMTAYGSKANLKANAGAAQRG